MIEIKIIDLEKIIIAAKKWRAMAPHNKRCMKRCKEMIFLLKKKTDCTFLL